MRTAFIVSALAFIVPALGAPTLIPIVKRDGPVKPDSYIVKFKDSASNENALAQLAERLKNSGPKTGSSMTYNYAPLWNGFAATLKGDDLTYVRSMTGVDYIEPDAKVSIVDYVPGMTPTPAPSGSTERIHTLVDRDGGASDGAVPVVYGIDTGIYTDHDCFEGRAKWGKTFGGYADADGNGHGTHTAGTAVGKGYGVAPKAQIIAVKVLSDQGSGSLSDVMAGVNWAFNDSKTRVPMQPAIATMSLGASDPAGMSKTLDQAVKNAIAGGMHFTIAAGNDNMDAGMSTPARVEEANTIGAVDSSKNNEKASFSNYGKLIDVWAPGVNIKSAWIGNPTAENTISGTSMATPYVAGVLAVALGEYGQMSPAELSEQLGNHATPAVTFAPVTDALAESSSNNLLAQTW